MKTINKLSEAQLALVARVRDEWNDVCLDTAPVDHARVREILCQLYAAAGKPAPKQINYLDSPLQVLNAVLKSRLEDEPASAETLTRIRYEAFKLVLAHVRHRVSDHARYRVSYLVRAQVREQVCKQFGIAYSDQSFGCFLESVLDQFHHQVRTKFSYHASRQADDQAHSQIVAQIEGPVWDQIYAQIDAQLSDQAGARFILKYDGEVMTLNLAKQIGGGINIFHHYISWYDSLAQLGIDASKLKPFLDLVKSCGWFVLTEDRAFISARPDYIKRDEYNRLHCETGPALRYPDGFSIFAIHGEREPEKLNE